MSTRKETLTNVIRSMRGILFAVLLMSGVVNVLMLTGAIYMLQIYDRVLTSHSVPTLVALSALVAGLYVLYGLLDVLRSQVLVRLGLRLDQKWSPLAHEALLGLSLAGAGSSTAKKPVRDVETVRSFLGSQGPIAIFDLPWMPMYIAFVFALHPWLGLLATAGVGVLMLFTLTTELLSRGSNKELLKANGTRSALVDGNVRNAEVLRAMGFADRAANRFAQANDAALAIHARASDLVGGLSGASRVFRLMLQSAVLGLGAYLTLQGLITAGAMIAASIATSRALAPVELAIGHWKHFTAARQSYASLRETIGRLPDEEAPLELPSPQANLTLEKVAIRAPSSTRILLREISFQLSAGDALGVIGPSGSGKSTLARAMTGVWPLAAGALRLDGAPVDRWPASYFTHHIGYLPQDVSLMDGTIAENISRFDPDADSKTIIQAARAASVHELILRLPDGYETQIGPDGAVLSAGQRQRIALARALYGNPFIVVMDEPNANLDGEGDAALTRAIQSIRERQGIAVVIAHRPSALQAVNLIALIHDGLLKDFGPKQEVLQKLSPRPVSSA